VRLVDCFIDTFLYFRQFERAGESLSLEYDAVRGGVEALFEQSRNCAVANGYSDEVYTSAKYAMVAYADEVIMTSPWPHKAQWQKLPLQRKYFDATNLGFGFYEKLNDLQKFGPDREVREVFSLCLGLGFRGKYFSNSDRQTYEEVKSFNLGILLPEEAQQNIDTAIIFPSAYGVDAKKISGDYKPRFNIIPYVIAAPFVLVGMAALYSNRSISVTLNAISSMVN
jgi:type VI secretion system protein ImpK